MTKKEAIERIENIEQDMRDFCDGAKHMSEKERLDLEALCMAEKALEDINLYKKYNLDLASENLDLASENEDLIEQIEWLGKAVENMKCTSEVLKADHTYIELPKDAQQIKNEVVIMIDNLLRAVKTFSTIEEVNYDKRRGIRNT